MAGRLRTRTWCATLALIVALGVSGGMGAQQGADRFWAQWRGPFATGVSRTATPPVEWSETKNIRWKVPIAGRSSSTPVVWGDRIFLLTAVAADPATVAGLAPRGSVPVPSPHKFIVMAIDRKTGKTVWERVAREETPHERHQENGTWASSSAVTDGEVVIATFESRGLHAYDMNGTRVWERDLGDKRMRSQFGEGSTPALHGRFLVCVWDHQGESFIVALDKRTGAEIWRQPRKEIDTWATPLITTVNGKAQVITGAMNQIQAYDLETGAPVWNTTGLTMNPIPSPVVEDGIAILMSGFRGNSLKAITLAEARGDITGTPAVAWTYERDTPYVPSPLLYDGVLYFLKSNNGILSVFDAKTGKPHYTLQRLDATPNVFASPVGAAGRVYIVGRDGATVVLKHGPTFEVLATNTLDDGFDASPALVDGELLLKGYRYLYSISNQ
ncbi:MAG TPA: PQQ-binding-like beta-propeller repeat protein [Vicinamibacterales bacterium]|nr:PQQ-binding-like beta-propeller repeat protein [Vicinamibacterales bacterium]